MDQAMRMSEDNLNAFVGLAIIKIAVVILCVTVFLAGCANDPLSGQQIKAPPGYLMAPPKKFPSLNEGDDAVRKLAEAAEVHNREARRIRGLQRYIRTVRKDD